MVSAPTDSGTHDVWRGVCAHAAVLGAACWILQQIRACPAPPLTCPAVSGPAPATHLSALPLTCARATCSGVNEARVSTHQRRQAQLPTPESRPRPSAPKQRVHAGMHLRQDVAIPFCNSQTSNSTGIVWCAFGTREPSVSTGEGETLQREGEAESAGDPPHRPSLWAL